MALAVEQLVVDASALVDFLLANAQGRSVGERLAAAGGLHAPAHLDAEVLSALARLERADQLSARAVGARLDVLAQATIERHPVAGLLRGAWRQRHNVRVADALYVELAVGLGCSLITTDARLAAATSVAEFVST